MKLGSDGLKKPFTLYSMTFFWFYYTQEKICKRNNDALTTDIVGLYRFTFFNLQNKLYKCILFVRKSEHLHNNLASRPS